MPLYDFICDSCDHEFEVTIHSSRNKEPLDEPCASCGVKGDIRRIFTTAGVADSDMLKADKNVESSGVGKRLREMKDAHPYMKWSG